MDHTWGSVGSPSSHHPYPTSTPQHHWNGRAVAANASWGKRKADDAADAAGKRRRVDAPSAANIPSCAGLPAQVWQNIFLYLPPVDLGRLLRVNRAFYTYLTQVAEPSNGSQRFSGRLRLQGSEAIWSSARKLHFPSLPKPLLTHTEWAMWSLLKSRRCQFCGLMPRDVPALDSMGETGPGLDGVRVVWPFGIRSCGSCLEQRSEKEQSLNNASVSSLLAALPFIYVTQDRNIVSSSSATSTPPNVELTKWYYRDHLREIQRQFEEVRAFGHATTEEWYKGLSATGKRKLADADRWERLERKGGLGGLIASSPAHALAPRPPSDVHEVGSSASGGSLHMGGVQRTAGPLHHPNMNVGLDSGARGPESSPGAVVHPRSERSIRDANEAKAARKADIERRCQGLNPPIHPNVLRHMKAFQAACQISTPMTDRAWEMLRPRIEAQRREAEQIEHERAAQMAALQVKLEDRRQTDASIKEVKEVLEREWEETQRPVRERLGAYADEIINKDWMEGQAITRDNTSQFAAELLIRVRERFYADQCQEDEATLAAGEEIREDPPAGPPTRRLILENMKWVFDNKIKPLTDQYRKELFLCNGEGCEGNPKLYGFEGVIQHFGAKHTTAFSVGNIVVHWKEADWPEDPPFHPDPANAKLGYHYAPYPASGPPGYPGNLGYGQYPYGGFSQGPSGTPNPESRTPLHFSHVSPGYGQPGPPANGPFPPPSTTSAGYFGNSAYQGPPYAPPGVPPGGPPGPYPSYPQPGPYEGPVPYDAYNSHHQVSPGPAYPPPGPPAGAPGYNNYPPGSFAPPSLAPSYSAGWGVSRPRSSHIVSSAFPPRGGPVPANMHEDEVRVLTDVAREIWTSTSGIRNLPASVRLSVVIHHVVYHFNLRFGIEPSLDLFADALESHGSMQDLKSVDNLSCKACVMGFHDHAMPSPSRDPEKNFYDVLSLFLHFRAIHVERISSAAQGFNINSHFQLDWKRDMVELPDDDLISGLIQSPGINDFKLRIIAEAFPRLFPAPLPHIGTVTSREPSPLADPVREPRGFRRESAVRPSMAREEPPDSRTGSAREFEERASIRPSGGHIPTSDGRSPYPHPGDEYYGPLAPAMGPHEREPRRESRQPSRRLSPYPGERRSRVYYEEPRYYVERGPSEYEYMPHPRMAYRPLSPPPPRRYVPYERDYNDPWARPRYEETYVADHGDMHERPHAISRLRYLDRPEVASSLGGRDEAPDMTQKRADDADGANERPELPIKEEDNTPAPADVAAAADRFLDDLASGERVRDFVTRNTERPESHVDRPDEALPASSRPPTAAPAGPEDIPSATGSQASPRVPRELERHVPAGSQISRASDVGMDDHYRREREAVHTRGEGYRPRLVYRDIEPRYFDLPPPPPRYSRHVGRYQGEPYPSSRRVVRAQSSRYSRYEATRRRIDRDDRERSRSPTRDIAKDGEPRPTHDRSPGPDAGSVAGNEERYRSDSRFAAPPPPPPPAPRDYPLLDERDRFSPPPRARYRYADSAPPTYVNEYGEVVDYVRMRDPYAERRYVAAPPPEPEPWDYVMPYERGHHRPPQPPSQYAYYPERRAYVANPDERAYEAEALGPPPGPGRREVRYADHAR